MRCMICEQAAVPFFSKTYTEPPISDFMVDIGSVEYWRCSACGFTLSKTHSELPPEKWERLNRQFHDHMEDQRTAKQINQPPYGEQALMISLLGRAGLIDTARLLDFAGGQGTLSKLLGRHFGLHLPIFDPYVVDRSGAEYVEDLIPRSWATVLNSAMFEHVLRRSDLDAVNAAVADDGALIIHTVICERIPRNPDWFYLAPPVHTALHTNASMNILMSQWGYRSSVYCPKAKCWTLFRQDVREIAPRVAELNQDLQSECFLAKSGFVDYWKGF